MPKWATRILNYGNKRGDIIYYPSFDSIGFPFSLRDIDKAYKASCIIPILNQHLSEEYHKKNHPPD